ncbi:hypothetical protein ABK040_009816 [Willaertia magna]
MNLQVLSLVPDQAINASCKGRFFGGSEEYVALAKSKSIQFFWFNASEEVFETKEIKLENIIKGKIENLITISFNYCERDLLFVIDGELYWFLVQINSNIEKLDVIDQGSLNINQYASAHTNASNIEKRNEELTRTVFPVYSLRKRKDLCEVILTIFDQYVHYIKFNLHYNNVNILENHLFDIKPNSIFTMKSRIYKVMDIDFLKNDDTDNIIEIAVLFQQFYNEFENNNYSLPSIPLTVLSTMVLNLREAEKNRNETKNETSKVFSVGTFAKSKPGPFSLNNLHPTTCCLFHDGYGMLCINTSGFLYYNNEGLMTESSIENRLTNSLVSPCHCELLFVNKQTLRVSSRIKQIIDFNLLILFSDGSLYNCSIRRQKYFDSKKVEVRIDAKRIVTDLIKIGNIYTILTSKEEGFEIYNLYIISPYENPQHQWVQISVSVSSEGMRRITSTQLKNYYAGVGSTIDEEQLPCLGTILHCFHQTPLNRDPRLICCSYSGSHNQYCQYVRGVPRISICQLGSRLIPFLPVSDEAMVEGMPTMKISIIFFCYDNCTTLFSTAEMEPLSLKEIHPNKRTLSIKEYRRNLISCFFVYINEDEICLIEYEFKTTKTFCLCKLVNKETLNFAEVDEKGRVVVATKEEILIYEIIQKPPSFYKVASEQFSNQISCLSTCIFNGNYLLLVGLWIENKIKVINTSSMETITEIQLHNNIRSVIGYVNMNDLYVIAGLSDGNCVINTDSNQSVVKVGDTPVSLSRVTSSENQEVIYCCSDRDVVMFFEGKDLKVSRVFKTVFFEQEKFKCGKVVSISSVITSQFGSCVIYLMEQHPDKCAIQFCELSCEYKLRWRSLELKIDEEKSSIVEPAKSIYHNQSKSYIVMSRKKSLINSSFDSLIFKCELDNDTEDDFYQSKVVSLKNSDKNMFDFDKDEQHANFTSTDIMSLQLLNGKELIVVSCIKSMSLAKGINNEAPLNTISVNLLYFFSGDLTNLKSFLIGERLENFHSEVGVLINGDIRPIENQPGYMLMIYNNLIHIIRVDIVEEKIKPAFISRFELFDFSFENTTPLLYKQHFTNTCPSFRSMHYSINSFECFIKDSLVYIVIGGIKGEIKILRLSKLNESPEMEELFIQNKSNTSLFPLSSQLVPTSSENSYLMLLADFVDGDTKLCQINPVFNNYKRNILEEFKIKDEDKFISSNSNSLETNSLFYFTDFLNRESKESHLTPSKLHLNPFRSVTSNHSVINAEKNQHYELYIIDTFKPIGNSIRQIVFGNLGIEINSKHNKELSNFIFASTDGEIGNIKILN